MPTAQVRDIASVTGNEAGQLPNAYMTARHLTAKLITELAHAVPANHGLGVDRLRVTCFPGQVTPFSVQRATVH
jgi:hypothetical protein